MSAVTDRIRNCCDQCAQSKIKCDSKRPSCANCSRRDRSCTYSYVRQSGRPRHNKSGQGNVTNHPKSTDRSGKATKSSPTSRQGRASTTAISPSPSVANAVSSFSRQQSYNPVQSEYGEELHYPCHEHSDSLFECNMALENMNVEYADSPSLGDIHHSISANYLAAAVTDPEMNMEFDFTGHNQTHEGDTLCLEQSLTLIDTSPESMQLTVDGIQLKQGLDGLIDDSVISKIVDGMINSPRKEKCIACVAELRDHCFHSCANDDPRQELCRCPTMLNKLYLVVMDPKLSQSTKSLPLDLILFLEQALHNTIEAIKQCARCGNSTLSSANGITLCIAANWIVNSIQTALESEIAMFTSTKSAHSLWSSPERHTNVSTSGDLPYINLQTSDPPPPSLDIRNSLRIGNWNASSKEWVLCVSEILASRIKRMQHTLSLVEDANAASEPVNTTTTDRIKFDMAKDVQAKSQMLLGMVKIWVSECNMGH